jgi:hypothetical protein
VSLKVYNVFGQEMATPISDFHVAENSRCRFDGVGQPSGLYFYRLIADGQIVQAHKMLLRK